MTAPLAVGLRMHGRRAVVIGGGDAAASAVSRLLSAGAEVLVVAPEVCTGLAELAARRLVSLRQREYLAADLDAVWLVLACGPADVNARAAADANERRIWTASDAEGSGRPAGQGSAELLPEPAGPVPAGRRVLVLGGARSGKSATAEAMLAGVPVVDYVATGQPAGAGDTEWDERVREHQGRRPASWRTLETGAVADVLTSKDSAAPVLVDCLATWLAQAMDDSGLWSGTEDADARLAGRTDGLVAAWQATSRHVIAVSNEVGCGVVPATLSGRRFRDELGWLNSRIASLSEEVWFCAAGIPRRLR
jgi:adenosylcobinamide kinase / adenosylcobinamide-phosphate guanylyltransferase